LNKTLLEHLPESAIFRIDHYLGKEPVRNLLYFRFANLLVEVGWDRRSIAEVQITLAESFGVGGRGTFYEEVGAIRDVVQSHMLQVVACLAMECPRQGDTESLRDEQARLLRAIRPLDPANLIRGQYAGYRQEPGVSPDSCVETYAAARLFIDNERWQGVPFYLRAGKGLPTTATEVIVRFKCPEQSLAPDCTTALTDYYRFRISPEVMIAIGARIKKLGASFEGAPIELLAHQEARDQTDPYERLLTDAAKGDPMLFTRQDGVEESWRIVEPVLGDPSPPREYARGTWGPEPLPDDFAPQDGWHNPVPAEETPTKKPKVAAAPLAEGARRLVANAGQVRSLLQPARGSGVEQP
jgi:glucose-6-phosphate 1-dehydrogenase